MNHGGNVWQGERPSDWLDYSANLRPEGAPRWVRDALTAGMENIRYYPDPQMRRARVALAEYLNLDAAQVLPTAGGISAIDLTAQLPASGALLATPCFGEYEMLCVRHDLPVRKASLLRENHVLGDPAIQLKDALFEGALVYLCNPLNPVGAAFTRDQVENLLHEVDGVNGHLVVDEAFIEYCPRHSVVDLIARHPRLLVTGCPNGGVRDKIIKAVEELGADVVAFDSCNGTREKIELVDEKLPVIKALAEKYLNINCSVMSHNQARMNDIRAMIDEYQVDGVIEIILQACHTYAIEACHVKKTVASKGVPYLCIETDYSQSDSGQIGTRLEAFLETIDK